MAASYSFLLKEWQRMLQSLQRPAKTQPVIELLYEYRVGLRLVQRQKIILSNG
jgi:hypothetical protein